MHNHSKSGIIQIRGQRQGFFSYCTAEQKFIVFTVKIQIMSVHLHHYAKQLRLVVCPMPVYNILAGAVPVMLLQHHYNVSLS